MATQPNSEEAESHGEDEDEDNMALSEYSIDGRILGPSNFPLARSRTSLSKQGASTSRQSSQVGSSSSTRRTSMSRSSKVAKASNKKHR